MPSAYSARGIPRWRENASMISAILLAQHTIQRDGAPARRRDGRDRPIVMCRPEPAGRHDQVVALERAQAVDDLVLAVSDEQDALQVDAETVERPREEARVAIGDEPEQQLAAR